MKAVAFPLIVALLSVSCSKGDSVPEKPVDGETNEVTDVINVTSDLSISLSCDKSSYKPGEKVVFNAEGIMANAFVRYRNLDKVIEESPLSTNDWSWVLPDDDFTGYMVDIYQKGNNGDEKILGTIGIDASSEWTRYPRYGFVAAFGNNKTDDVIEKEMAFLSRYHINGVQFQDWHNKHHWPLGGTRDKLDEVYKDIANRDIYTNVVKKYIEVQHKYGMKSMFYNLCYGALSDASDDGVKEEWYQFQDINHSVKDIHELLKNNKSWKSDIYLLDPSNSEWQKYIAQRNDDVYANLAFDGYQIDQLGDRGDRFNYKGEPIYMAKAFASFINAMKSAHPDKYLVMNAVGGFGSQQIASTNNVGFLYNEVWDNESQYKDLKNIIEANDFYSNNTLRTVFAAYMNYKKANSSGYFNTPGILLTDATMFALGATHLELGGDHMLCKEYFPNSNLKMKDDLKEALVHYYDFLVAYENILMDNNSEDIDIDISSSLYNINSWPPKKGAITYYSKKVGNRYVVSLLNYQHANTLDWNDANGDMPEPSLLSDIDLKIPYTNKVNKIWIASPDINGGALQMLPFKQTNGIVDLKLPSLKYWSLIVIE